MLTDIFATRYAARPIWNGFGPVERTLIVQGYRIVSEQLMRYYTEAGKVDEANKKQWDSIESKLSMELGLESLSPKTYGYYNQAKFWISGTWGTDHVCKTWMLADFRQGDDADRFIKERISFLEIAFREREAFMAESNRKFDLYLMMQVLKEKQTVSIKPGQSQSESMKSANAEFNAKFASYVDELNTRFVQAKAPLTYHNGFIQLKGDELTDAQISTPFWNLVKAPKWTNVSIDMAEAIDRRDTGGRDPALYAAKALESVIKIVSDEKGWTRGNEKGAANYIDNLVSDRNGVRFIEVWEKDFLISYFGKVRNPLGHGPGGEAMPALTADQTNWAIENAMSWCKSLIERHS
jgi:hypothetical protein